MRLALLSLLLALSVALAGCTFQTDPPAAAAVPEETPPQDAETVEPAETDAPQDEETPAPPTSDANETEGEETPPPQPVAVPADHHEEIAGWVGAVDAGGEPFSFTMAVPVREGASNLTLQVDVSNAYPFGSLPRETANVTLTLRSGDGAAIAGAWRDVTNATGTVAIALDDPPLGNHTLIVEIWGGSDGESMGDRYRAVVHVAYAAPQT